MRKLFSSLSTEELSSDELEVNKVLDEATGKTNGDGFDTLFQDLKDKNDKPIEDESTDTSIDNTPTDTPTETDSNPTDTKEPTDEDVDLGDDNVSVESFVNLHNEVAVEDIFTKDNAMAAASFVGNNTLDGAKYLAALGIKYAPIAARKIHKAVIFSIEKSIKAIMLGSIAINKFVRKRISSFKNYKKKIVKLKLALVEYNKLTDKPEVDKAKLIYNNSLYISQLKVGKDYNFDKHCTSILKLLDSLDSTLKYKVAENINGTRNMINKLISQDVISPVKMPIDIISIPNTSKRVIGAYKPTSEHVDSITSNEVLPGDQLLIGFSPKANLTEPSEIVDAYNHAKLFIGLASDKVESPTAVPFIDINLLSKYLDNLEKICDHELFKEKLYNDLVKSRDSLKPNIRKYMDHLYESEEKISLKDSMVNYLGMKIKFLDTTYIAGTMMVENYTLKYLNASTQYCMSLIKACS